MGRSRRATELNLLQVPGLTFNGSYPLQKQAIPTTGLQRTSGCVLSGTEIVVMYSCRKGTAHKKQQVGKQFHSLLLRHESHRSSISGRIKCLQEILLPIFMRWEQSAWEKQGNLSAMPKTSDGSNGSGSKTIVQRGNVGSAATQPGAIPIRLLRVALSQSRLDWTEADGCSAGEPIRR